MHMLPILNRFFKYMNLILLLWRLWVCISVAADFNNKHKSTSQIGKCAVHTVV